MLNIGLVGVGLVGKAFVKEIFRKDNPFQTQAPFKLVGLINSRKQAFSPQGFSSDSQAFQELESGNSASLESFIKEFEGLEGNKVIVDCTSNQDVAEKYPSWLSKKFNIVTPNKKPFSSDLKLFKEIFQTAKDNGVNVGYESTVGAGLPVIRTLSHLVNSGDKADKIEGIFSGTLSHLFNTYSSLSNRQAQSFAQIVKKAQEDGYTEPDPRDDLSGMDVARKLVILARTAGWDLSLEQVQIDNLVPEALQSVATSQEFLERLPEFDAHFSKLNEDALNNNQVLRYVGQVDSTGAASVKLSGYDAAHPFASLTLNNNIASFKTAHFPSPLIIQGAGAGDLVTVFGILADLLTISKIVEH
ncbi:hypothetical protein CONCODRAFT_80201 [Conidiobolus coronatus NRRL 28638]|uniref:Homoserine dehydrogenase n=1 Tax=Conidiobolus coronatus (strain ATCC 28846 / CBS 209.66 / NRRL 28638) TaxID=796925 RepID=A0A137NWZ1_CONC2|nr:hypothetical protein CONCODRAFT_80201 [Conidiobolus coronatus NRRL 28638]|eukprot:KXN67360.1 hypothetical protein CONCODRAFT_80201 [Conidiobolus coronatus NRRL 28638]